MRNRRLQAGNGLAGSLMAEAAAEHGKVGRRRWSGAAERSRRAGMNMNDEVTRWP